MSESKLSKQLPQIAEKPNYKCITTEHHMLLSIQRTFMAAAAKSLTQSSNKGRHALETIV